MAAVEWDVIKTMNAHHKIFVAYCSTNLEPLGILFLEVTSAIDDAKTEVKTIVSHAQVSIHASPDLALASDGTRVPLLTFPVLA